MSDEITAIVDEILGVERKLCVNCRSRYSPLCKYCDNDGTCSRHGVKYVDQKCPICGRTFEEDFMEARDIWEKSTALERQIRIDQERDRSVLHMRRKRLMRMYSSK